MRVIACAILDDRTGRVWSLPAPARHCDVFALMERSGCHPPPRATQGFLLEDGGFAGREEALVHACRSGQVRRAECHRRLLFSEDVW